MHWQTWSPGPLWPPRQPWPPGPHWQPGPPRPPDQPDHPNQLNHSGNPEWWKGSLWKQMKNLHWLLGLIFHISNFSVKWEELLPTGAGQIMTVYITCHNDISIDNCDMWQCDMGRRLWWQVTSDKWQVTSGAYLCMTSDLCGATHWRLDFAARLHPGDVRRVCRYNQWWWNTIPWYKSITNY